MGHFNDAWDDLLFNPERYEDYDGAYGPNPVRCKYCGATNVYWKHLDDGRWRLLTMGSNDFHTCKSFQRKREWKD